MRGVNVHDDAWYGGSKSRGGPSCEIGGLGLEQPPFELVDSRLDLSSAFTQAHCHFTQTHKGCCAQFYITRS